MKDFAGEQPWQQELCWVFYPENGCCQRKPFPHVEGLLQVKGRQSQSNYRIRILVRKDVESSCQSCMADAASIPGCTC